MIFRNDNISAGVIIHSLCFDDVLGGANLLGKAGEKKRKKRRFFKTEVYFWTKPFMANS